tara:strand:- start:2415 stop:4235 length:1821 start_codon:yes stop_codon:yes gene_type:complete
MAYQERTPQVALNGQVSHEHSDFKTAFESSTGKDLSGHSWVLFISDIHFEALGAQTNSFAPGIEKEFKRLQTNSPPDKVVIGGDILSSYVLSFGYGPYPDNYGEVEAGKANASIPRVMGVLDYIHILGNHDTGPNEDPPNSFLVSKCPWYDGVMHHSWELNGVHNVAVSTTHDADLAKSGGTVYLKAYLDAITDTKDVIIYIHQPALASLSAEYGMREGILAAVPAGMTNNITILGGHQHLFGDQMYTVHATTAHQWTIACASPDAFNPDGSSPAMAALILKDGAIVDRMVFNGASSLWTVMGYNVDRGTAADLPEQTAGVDGVLDIFYKEGSYDRAGKIVSAETTTWRDTGSWLASVKEMQVVFPLPEDSNNFFVSSATTPTTPMVSLDGSSWEAVSATLANGILNYPIPTLLIGDGTTSLHFKADWAGANGVGGWGFSTVYIPPPAITSTVTKTAVDSWTTTWVDAADTLVGDFEITFDFVSANHYRKVFIEPVPLQTRNGSYAGLQDYMIYAKISFNMAFYKNNALQTSPSYAANDTFGFKRVGSTMAILKNGVVTYTFSGTCSTADMKVSSELYSQNGDISNLKIGGVAAGWDNASAGLALS